MNQPGAKGQSGLISYCSCFLLHFRLLLNFCLSLDVFLPLVPDSVSSYRAGGGGDLSPGHQMWPSRHLCPSELFPGHIPHQSSFIHSLTVFKYIVMLSCTLLKTFQYLVVDQVVPQFRYGCLAGSVLPRAVGPMDICWPALQFCCKDSNGTERIM